jgi:hypothetical protein
MTLEHLGDVAMDLPSFILSLGQLFNQFVTIVVWPIVVAILIYALRDPLRDLVRALIATRSSRTNEVPPPPQVPPSA